MVINASKQQTRDSAFLKYIIAIMISIFPYLLYAQSYKGTVVDMQNNPVAFANITTLTTDSTFITGTVSNDDGSFQINANSTVALLKISYIGYQELILPVSMDKTELGTIQLEDGNLRLDEVVVEANLNKVFGERREFLFSPDDKLKANSGLDLMRNVPQLSLNDMTNKLQTANGGTVKVLLNGLMVEETDLIGLRPEDIIKVEYYSQPPARYANLGVDAVLNVVVRRSDNGGYIMANIRQGLTTGFGTDIIQGKLSKGDNDYSLRYFLDYLMIHGETRRNNICTFASPKKPKDERKILSFIVVVRVFVRGMCRGGNTGQCRLLAGGRGAGSLRPAGGRRGSVGQGSLFLFFTRLCSSAVVCRRNGVRSAGREVHGGLEPHRAWLFRPGIGRRFRPRAGFFFYSSPGGG